MAVVHTIKVAAMSGAFALAVAVPLSAETSGAETRFSIEDTRTEMAGTWRGSLDYRDYQADRWFGIPVTVSIESVEDGVTEIRKSAYDDGPARGTVHITNVAMLSPDSGTEYIGSFRADRPAELYTQTVRLAAPAEGGHNPTSWTIIAERDGADDNRPARIRETTVRVGDTITSLKEIDFADDAKTEWLKRNRTVLQRIEQ